MPILPRTRVARLQWAEAHEPLFTLNATAIGLTSAQCTTMGTKNANVRALLLAQEQAIEAAKLATYNFYQASNDLTSFCAVLLKDIKAAASTNSAVWGLANVPAPSEPGPIPAPGTPDNFKAALLPGGALELSWKCANGRSTGVTYYIERRIDGQGTFTLIGVTGPRTWLDETVPANSGPITYRITAVRSTAKGTPNLFGVNFGVDAGTGATIATVAPRMAA